MRLSRVPIRIRLVAIAGLALIAFAAAGAQPSDPSMADGHVPLAAAFDREVAHALHPPPEEVEGYATLLQLALEQAGAEVEPARFILLVDRSPKVQAMLVYWGSASTSWRLVGAAPVSTGLAGRFEHFATPLGVFDHVLANPDFRAEGTKNELGIRGYGLKGSRVYDFGWAAAPKGWGNGAMSVMRLQMHSTDPDVLEPRLGSARSKGCVRIPASLNEFIDRHGVLDAAYDAALAGGARFWVLREDRASTPWAGRYLVVVETTRERRPKWSRWASPSRQ